MLERRGKRGQGFFFGEGGRDGGVEMGRARGSMCRVRYGGGTGWGQGGGWEGGQGYILIVQMGVFSRVAQHI